MAEDRDFFATGPADTAFSTHNGEQNFKIGGVMEGSSFGFTGQSSASADLLVPIVRTGVWGRADNVGVYAQTTFPAEADPPRQAAVIATSSRNIAVAAFSDFDTAVHAHSGFSPFVKRLFPKGAITARSTDNLLAMSALSSKFDAVQGASFGSRGVSGYSSANYGLYGLSFARPVPGTNPADLPAGVYGESANGSFGVLGVAKRTGVGIAGVGSGDALAGFFDGNLVVTGQIFAGTKDAMVAFPDGSKRLLHCMESPEHWFEDFGSARLTRGRATVKLDANFARVVKLNEYRVFLTPEGNCQGLYVLSKRGTNFEVRELQGGTSNAPFSYRIVAKRKDIKAHTRFAKIDTTLPMPTGKARAARQRKAARLPSSMRALLAALAKHASKKAA
jgi:hypothetical protein